MVVLGFRTHCIYVDCISFAELFVYYNRNKFFLHNPKDVPNALPVDKTF